MPPLLLLLYVLAQHAGGAWGFGDPCQSSNHKDLDDDRRSTAYNMVRGEPALCDQELQPGWYRFTGGAGGRLPERCQPRYKCGTLGPIWMNGTHPSISEGMASRTVCANTGYTPESARPCCGQHMEIGVKNCDGFFVYYLKPPQGCPMAYCAGDKAPCPAGKWSSTGFSPCLDVYPRLETDPKLSPPEVVGQTFRFTCNVTYPQHDPSLRFEVQWTFDGQTDPNIPTRQLSDPQRQAFLPGTALHGHLGHTVGCRIRAWYANRPTVEKSPWRESNTYYAGLRVEPGKVEVSEKGGNSSIRVTSTLPLICDHNFIASCCLHLMLDVDGPRNNVQVPSHPCSYSLCQSAWDPASHTASRDITVEATKDGIRDGDKQMLLAFERLQTVGSGPYLDVFNNVSLPSTPITARDAATKTCSWSGDPHIIGFSGNRFNLYDTGDYTMYENTKDNFEVQARTYLCAQRVSCQCGIAIREHNDIIRISSCAHRDHAPIVETNHQPLREGTVIQRSNDGKHVVIYLPSGREVRVDVGREYHNVQVTVPASDDGEGRGICGTLDDDNHNEYMHRDGTLNDHDRHGHHDVPEQFEESWRNDKPTSLFETLPASIDERKEEPHYCQCDKGENGPARINCSVAADNAHRTLRCGGNPCRTVTENLPTFMTSGWSTRRDVAALYADVDEPDPPFINTRNSPSQWNVSWPTQSGITESQARDRCTGEIRNAQLFEHCHDNTQLIDHSVQSCVEDVLFSDNFDFVTASVSGFTASCQFEMMQDVNNYVTDSNNNLVLKTAFSEVCSESCLQHGRCVRGRCVCDAGYTGDNCQLIAGQGPTLLGIRGSSTCDVNQRPCRKIFFNAEHFQMSDDFKCRVQEIMPSGDLSSVVVEEPAQFISGNRLACPLPDPRLKTDRSFKIFAVSVTFDGQHYSNVLHVTTFDSTCQSCDQTGCTQKANTCLINNLCYVAGDINSDDETKSCKPSQSTSQWSTLRTHNYPDVSAPTLTGPDSDHNFMCTIYSATEMLSARFEVTWLLDGQTVRRQTMPGGLRHAYLKVSDLPPGSGTVQCQVRSFYAGQSDISDYMQSNGIAL